MKKIYSTLFALVSFNFMFAQSVSKMETNQIVIKIKNVDFSKNNVILSNNKFGITAIDNINAVELIHKIEPIGNYKITNTFLLTFKNIKNVVQLCVKYAKLNFIEFAEPNFIAENGGNQADLSLATIPTDTFFNRQWGLYNTGTLSGVGTITNDSDVDMELAWDIQTGDPNMIIAVPDSGLRLTHPDIASRIWVNSGEIASNGIDDDNNGYIDDINGWDWVNSDNNPTDDHGHGTNVCGIIGAIPNNNNLYAGANWNSKIMPLKVLNASNSGSYAGMANSIYYAVDKGAKIISMSIGGTSASTLLSNSINYANTNNVLFVTCMMNNNNNIINYPAGYSTTYSNVISVGSTNPNDQRSAPFFWSTTSGSNFGNHINVVAPGNFTYGLSNTSDTSTNYWGGTSQATPLVASIASLMLAQNPSLTPNQIRTILQNTAEDQKGLSTEDIAGFDQYHGWGRVNAYQALQQVLNNQEFNKFEEQFKIVNPVQNKVLEIFNNSTLLGNFKIKIYNIEGKLISDKSINLNANKNVITLNNPSGLYILSLENEKFKKIYKITIK